LATFFVARHVPLFFHLGLLDRPLSGVGRSKSACAECATPRFAALSLGRHLRFPLLVSPNMKQAECGASSTDMFVDAA